MSPNLLRNSGMSEILEDLIKNSNITMCWQNSPYPVWPCQVKQWVIFPNLIWTSSLGKKVSSQRWHMINIIIKVPCNILFVIGSSSYLCIKKWIGIKGVLMAHHEGKGSLRRYFSRLYCILPSQIPRLEIHYTHGTISFQSECQTFSKVW